MRNRILFGKEVCCFAGHLSVLLTEADGQKKKQIENQKLFSVYKCVLLFGFVSCFAIFAWCPCMVE